jgi:hypothetical protein
MTIIDIQANGIGDVVLACWLVTSARAGTHELLINARKNRVIPPLLNLNPSEITTQQGHCWTTTPGLGLQFEYSHAPSNRSRFQLWAESLGLTDLEPVRPAYRECREAGYWSERQWVKVDQTHIKPRILVFPDAARSIRAWPLAYFCDFVDSLNEAGWAVAAMAEQRNFVSHLNCKWWFGFQRLHTSIFCSAESPNRFPGFINTTFKKQLYTRWCCIDRLNRQR